MCTAADMMQWPSCIIGKFSTFSVKELFLENPSAVGFYIRPLVHNQGNKPGNPKLMGLLTVLGFLKH